MKASHLPIDMFPSSARTLLQPLELLEWISLIVFEPLWDPPPPPPTPPRPLLSLSDLLLAFEPEGSRRFSSWALPTATKKPKTKKKTSSNQDFGEWPSTAWRLICKLTASYTWDQLKQWHLLNHLFNLISIKGSVNPPCLVPFMCFFNFILLFYYCCVSFLIFPFCCVSHGGVGVLFSLISLFFFLLVFILFTFLLWRVIFWCLGAWF